MENHFNDVSSNKFVFVGSDRGTGPRTGLLGSAIGCPARLRRREHHTEQLRGQGLLLERDHRGQRAQLLPQGHRQQPVQR